MLGDGVHIEIDVFGIPNTLPKEAEIAASLQRVELLVLARSELIEKEQVELLDRLDLVTRIGHIG